MSKGNLVEFKKPAGVDDPVTEALRQGARKLLAQAIEAEVEAFLAEHAELALANGHRRVVPNGYLSEREVQTGIGPVALSMPSGERQGRSWRRRQGAFHFQNSAALLEAHQKH